MFKHSNGILAGVVFAIIAVAQTSAPALAADAGPQQASRVTVPGDLDLSQLNELKGAYRRPGNIPFPAENPYSDAKAELGKMLFFDPRLSGADIVSCASCHNPSFGWEDARPLGVGNGRAPAHRHTPTVLNLAWAEIFNWDGRAESLEEQVLMPIVDVVEMDQPLDGLLAELRGLEGYRQAFDLAFPGEGITAQGLAMALATYMRTIVSAQAPFDRWIEGDEAAIGPRAKRGFVIYNTKARCSACHSGWNLTDDSFHDIGLPTDDPGRAKIVDLPMFRHAFKTPGLRNIRQRAPYMHNGSVKTLAEVVDHYNDGFIRRATLSDDIKPLNLSLEERSDLIAFLETLSGRDAPVEIPLLPID